MPLFSLFALKRKHSRWLLRHHGLQPYVLHLPTYGCNVHCWAPSSSLHNAAADNEQTSSSSSQSRSSTNSHASPHGATEKLPSGDVDHKQLGPPPAKPALVLLHGFGADGSIAWDNQVAQFSKHFSLYLPDLLFFGNSTIAADKLDSGPDITQTQHTGTRSAESEEKVRYSEIFQAKCMHEAMQRMGVREAIVLGHSYGGFVAYHMAHLYPSFVKKLVVLSSGIMMNPHSNDRLLSTYGSTHIRELLVPPTLPLYIKSLQLVFNDFLPTWLPSFIYNDMYESFSGDREGKIRLEDDIILGKEGAPPLPTIEQNTLILWGEEDQIFDISLAHQLKEFLGAKATLSTIKGVGHMPQMVKPKEFNHLVLSSLLAKQ